MMITRTAAAFAALSIVVSLAGCADRSHALPIVPQPQSVVATGLPAAAAPWQSKIKHVIIIIQENRTPDNMFNGLPGADTRSWGLDHNGNRVPLIQISETAPYDLSHTHRAFVNEYDRGKLDRFDLERGSKCLKPGGACPPNNRRAYGIVPRTESKPYWDMAAEWGFGDRMFQTNQGPSFPAHQYLISGTSTIRDGSNLRAAENPQDPTGSHAGGCDSPKGALVSLIDQTGAETQQVYPCFQRLTLMDLLDAKSVVWHYYQFSYSPGLWAAPDAIRHIRNEPHYKTEVAAPSHRVLSDILNGDLEAVSWVTPDKDDSDHARVTDGSGPSWVTSIVNAVGTSKYWKDTVIFITWDDWGGWYDHVKPPIYDSYELGFRVPLLVISPYAKKAYVSHQQHEFGSLLKFVEETFGLGSLGTTDVRADDCADFFDFTMAPRKYVPIHSPVGPMYFINKPASDEPPDDDS